MEVWPAIDLRGGKCVRLRQGDYGQETVFGDDPAAMARHWVDFGAQCLHLVDLDGAREGRPVNIASVEAIVKSSGVPCELGGGIRTDYAIQELFKVGIARVIIGTLSLNSCFNLAHSCGLSSVLVLLGNNRAIVSNQSFSTSAPGLPGFASFSATHASSMVATGALGGGVVGRATPCAPLGTGGTRVAPLRPPSSVLCPLSSVL